MLEAILKVNKEIIAELKIVNDKKGTLRLGNYRYSFWNKVGEKILRVRGTYKNYPREKGAPQLVSEILDKITKARRRAIKNENIEKLKAMGFCEGTEFWRKNRKKNTDSKPNS